MGNRSNAVFAADLLKIDRYAKIIFHANEVSKQV